RGMWNFCSNESAICSMGERRLSISHIFNPIALRLKQIPCSMSSRTAPSSLSVCITPDEMLMSSRLNMSAMTLPQYDPPHRADSRRCQLIQHHQQGGTKVFSSAIRRANADRYSWTQSVATSDRRTQTA